MLNFLKSISNSMIYNVCVCAAVWGGLGQFAVVRGRFAAVLISSGLSAALWGDWRGLRRVGAVCGAVRLFELCRGACVLCVCAQAAHFVIF